ncbi:HNH endonuclease, partial [Flavobacterium filum]|uniref:HNH endonuclease n=1 Tax=Flavobacterium filum TaxID=370974 RepID=UPI0023F2CEBB
NWSLMPSGYVTTRMGKSKIYLHQFVTGLKGIDHKNNDKRDNQKSNLREATKQQNNWNVPKYKTKTTSKYKGVHWCNRQKRWTGRIFHNGKAIYIGSYKDERLAGIAYNEKAKQLFGEFAYVNPV